MLKISIIICTYNRDKYIYNTLRCIAVNDFSSDEYEIVLINNNSTDSTEKECSRFQIDFRQIVFRYYIETHQGLSYARNRGLREAEGDFFVFLDDDSLVKSNYMKNLRKHLNSFPDLYAYGGKIKPLYESGNPPKWMSKWTYSWVSAIDLGNHTRKFPNDSYPLGANMGFSRNCAVEAGLFNVHLGRNAKNLMGGEEKDFFNRVKANNKKIYYFPDMEVEHVIPVHRTTIKYIVEMSKGIGISERLRTLDISFFVYSKRLIAEGVKWMASIILLLGYTVTFHPGKGIVLLLSRWHITKGLLNKYSMP
jgi:glycosyltransferase involved in cell wall biosynthesis